MFWIFLRVKNVGQQGSKALNAEIRFTIDIQIFSSSRQTDLLQSHLFSCHVYSKLYPQAQDGRNLKLIT